MNTKLEYAIRIVKHAKRTHKTSSYKVLYSQMKEKFGPRTYMYLDLAIAMEGGRWTKKRTIIWK